MEGRGGSLERRSNRPAVTNLRPFPLPILDTRAHVSNTIQHVRIYTRTGIFHEIVGRPPPPYSPLAKDSRPERGKSRVVLSLAVVYLGGHPKSFTPIWTDAAPTSIRATIIGQLKPAESVRVTWHPIIIRYPRGGSTTAYPRGSNGAGVMVMVASLPPLGCPRGGGSGWI